MADCFVQQNARPAGPEYHVHLAGRGRNRIEVNQCLTIGFVDLRPPCVGLDIRCVTGAAASTMAARLHTVTVGANDGYIQSYERTDIAAPVAVGADNLDRLPFA